MKKRTRFAEETINVGLCCTCRNLPTCAIRDIRCTVIACEEFCSEELIIHPEKVSQPESVVEHALAKGLCANCEDRETCTLPKSETGVWHCEQYR